MNSTHAKLLLTLHCDITKNGHGWWYSGHLFGSLSALLTFAEKKPKNLKNSLLAVDG